MTRPLRTLLAASALAAATLFAIACRGPAAPVGTPPATPEQARPSSTATVVAGVASPTLPRISTPAPPTTPADPGGSQGDWADARISAVEAIWGFTPEGEHWLESYDFRQMVAQPAWFGSHGNTGWAGAGEANPRIVMHELSHSYWGAFQVDGRPDLSWTATGPGGVSVALAGYHADLDAFLRQPPDRFEPLRDRFRNLPNLTVGSYPDLHHFGEADMIEFTGGDLDLVPPTLRKYYVHYLRPDGVGDFTEWADAVAWFKSLQGTDRSVAEQVFGIQHFPLERYEGLVPVSGAALRPEVVAAVRNEERQRLIDFSEQFDAIKEAEFGLVDAAGVDRGFSFWSGYLSDKRDLHRIQPDVLRESLSPRAADLGAALDFYVSIQGDTPEQQAAKVRERLGDVTIRELAVLLKPRAIVELFASADSDAGVEAVISGRARALAEIARNVDAVVSLGRSSPAAGAAELERYLASLTNAQLSSDLPVILDMLRDTDRGVANAVMPLLSDAMLLRLLDVAPSNARSAEISPARLLAAVGITPEANRDAIAAGARLLTERTSGNFAIDLPYDEAVFQALEALERRNPGALLAVLAESRMRLLPWVERGGDSSLDALRRDLAAAARLLASVPGPRETPEMLLHALIQHDPDLAATLLIEMESQGVPQIAERSILTLAYDGYWWSRGSGPGVDPVQGQRFLARLVELNGRETVSTAAAGAMAFAGEQAANGDLEAEFTMRLAAVLQEAGIPF